MKDTPQTSECARCAAGSESILGERDHPGSDNHDHAHGHDHTHSHDHSHGASAPLPRIVASFILLAAGIAFNRILRDTPGSWAEYAVLAPAYLLVGWPVIREAFRGLLRREYFDENALMTIASLGAFAVGELPEAAGVMVFYAIGEYVQGLSVARSRRSIASLLDIRPDHANLKTEEGISTVAPELVKVGDVIVVKPGERVPLDGEVMEGNSFLDTSALTGESIPREAGPGSSILSGMVNGRNLLTVRVVKPSDESTVSRILRLVEDAAAKKAPTEKFITTFSRYYTPSVVFGAIAVAVLPPLLVTGQVFSHWFYRALTMLVISCPCALVISIPLGYFGGIGGAARNGVLIKGSNYLDALSSAHTVVFDKTGTLTKGVFKVTRVIPAEGFTADQVLSYASGSEAFSSHPIANSIRQAYVQKTGFEIGGPCPGDHEGECIRDYSDKAGQGVSATVHGRRVLAGKGGHLESEGVVVPPCDGVGTIVHVAVEGAFAGCITISDEPKEDAKEAVTDLRTLGVKRVAMLTGDQEPVAAKIAGYLGLDEFHHSLLPEDKVRKLEEIKAGLPNPKDRLVFVGDGINDAPVIARADVGVAMGGLGSDAAIEAADVVLMEDAPSKLATAIRISRWTRRVVMENIALALGVKGIFLALGISGMANIWEAVFADVGVALLAIANATRTLRYRGK